MSGSESGIDEKLAALVEVTDALLRGEYDHAESNIDAEGILSDLTKKINSMVVNLRSVEDPLTAAGEAAPNILLNANNVVDLMSQSTAEVLDKADKLTQMADTLTETVKAASNECPKWTESAKNQVNAIKSTVFDIIASQSYQDVARQKMEAMLGDLSQTRDWLLETLIILNIKKDASAANVLEKTKILKAVKKDHASAPGNDLSQDLVDDLLAEFGF